jgi:archaellum component FlaG (FlaF/FlaG flagellin family)
MKTIYIHFTSIVFFWALSIAAFAQAPTFTAQVSSNQVSIDEQFQVSFSLNGSGKNFQAPALNDFTVLSGPNQSSSVQIVNGSMSQSISYTYYLMPKNQGTFTIGSASIVVDGKTLKSNPVKITVSKGSANGSQKSDNSESIESQIAKNLFIKATANNTNPYVGEGITVTYKLYTRVDLVDFSLNKKLALDGFWSQDIESIKQPKHLQENVDGVIYNVADIKKTILFPIKEGQLKIDKMTAESIVRVRTQRKRAYNDPFADFFDDPFFGGGNVQDIKYVVNSNVINIQVKPLSSKAPQNFSGAVGKYKLEAFLDKSQTKANESITLKLKIMGKGNLKLLEPPVIDFPPDFETYEPKINDQISVGMDGVKGARIFEYLLIPRREGTYKINPIVFSFFDLDKKQFETLSSPELIVNVKGGLSQQATINGNAVSKSEVQNLGTDIKYISTQAQEFVSKGNTFYGSFTYFLWMAFSPLALIGFLIFRKKQAQEASDVLGTKSRKATKLAKSRLAKAEKLLKQNKHSEVYEAILQAFWGYIADKYKVPVSELNKEKIQQILSENHKNKESIDRFIKIIDDCEFARYAPTSSLPNAQQVYHASIESISNLE